MMKNYDGTMIMPANYAVVTNEEMTYLDGGVQVNWKSWGVSIVMSKAESQRFQNGIYYYTSGITVTSMIAAKFGPVGWLAGAAVGSIGLYWGLVGYKLSNKTTRRGAILNIHSWGTFAVKGR